MRKKRVAAVWSAAGLLQAVQKHCGVFKLWTLNVIGFRMFFQKNVILNSAAPYHSVILSEAKNRQCVENLYHPSGEATVTDKSINNNVMLSEAAPYRRPFSTVRTSPRNHSVILSEAKNRQYPQVIQYKAHKQVAFSLAEAMKATRALNNPRPAFSLAEAMITLLLVSIIMAAVAPLMSKRLRLTQTGFSSTIKNNKKTWLKTIPGSYDFPAPVGVTDYIVSMSAGGGGGGNAAKAGVNTPITATSQQNITIPTGVSTVKLTLVGAGAGGGGSTASGSNYTGQSGNKNFTGTGSFTFSPNMINSACTSFANTAVSYEIVGGGSTANPGGSGGRQAGSTTFNGNSSVSGTVGGAGNPGGTSTFNGISATGGSNSTAGSPGGNAGLSRNACEGEMPLSCSIGRAMGWDEVYTNSTCTTAVSIPCGCYSYTVANRFNATSTNCTAVSYVVGGGSWKTGYHKAAWVGIEMGNYLGLTSIPTSTFYRGGYAFSGYGKGYGSNDSSPSATAGRVYLSWSGQSCSGVIGYAGGGGGGGSQRVVSGIAVQKGDILTVNVGVGGNGGAAAATGANGGVTSVVHKRGAATIATYTVNGGTGGSGASNSGHGAGGAGGTGETAGLSGEAGTSSNGGQGANIVISGTTYAGGTGGTSSAINGQSPSNAAGYGAGGGGGFASDGANKGLGGKGANGFVRVEYDVSMAGGGGGGGASINVFNIKTQGEDKIPVVVGAGGDATINGANTSFGSYAITEGGKAGLNGVASSVNYGANSTPGKGGLGGTIITTTPPVSVSDKAKWVGQAGLSASGIAGGTGGSSHLGVGACGGMSNSIFPSCTETNQDGLTALNFDSTKLKNGGAGGGGGGINGSKLGIGGKGGDGFIVIEWE